MITEKLKKNWILNKKGKASAEDVWFELTENCKPTVREFKKYTHGLLFTSEIMYWLLGKMGVWHYRRPTKRALDGATRAEK